MSSSISRSSILFFWFCCLAFLCFQQWMISGRQSVSWSQSAHTACPFCKSLYLIYPALVFQVCSYELSLTYINQQLSLQNASSYINSQSQQMDPQIQPPNIQHIVQALTAIHQQGATSQQIRNANAYLTICESQPRFVQALLNIYCNINNVQLQLSSILLLTNVIKRNWNTKRNSRVAGSLIFVQNQKEQLRNSLLQAYTLHEMRHYKHFNNLIKYLTRIDFPAHYSQLHNFVLTSLQQLMAMEDINAVVSNNRVMTVLSTCKAVMKEYSLKKVAHNQQIFLKYITNIVKQAVTLSRKLHSYLLPWLENGSFASVVKLLECLRKVDKVIAYGLASMPSLYQYHAEISQIVLSLVEHISVFDGLLAKMKGNKDNEDVREQIQKYIAGILQQIGRLQSYYPFLFSSFLGQYLIMLVNMLVKQVADPHFYQCQKLLSAIVIANFKPFTVFAYYLPAQQFKSTIYCRKSSQVDNLQLQKQCSQQFRQVYTQESITQLFQAVITQVMTASHVTKHQRELHQDLVLEDMEIAIVDQVSEPNIYQNCVNFCKNLIKCFKNQTKQFVKELIQSVPVLRQQHIPVNEQIISNIMQIVLVIPHIYQSGDLPIQQICGILQVLYDAQQFAYLARLIRKYHSYLNQATLITSFKILAKIVSSPIAGAVTPQIIYQCALGLKTLLVEVDVQSLPLQLMGGCISNVVAIMTLKQFMVNPTLMWPVINLLIKLVKSIPTSSLVEQAAAIVIRGLSPIINMDKNQQLIVCALCELLSTLINVCLQPIKLQFPIRGQLVQPQQKIVNMNRNSLLLLQASLILIRRNIKNIALQNYDNIYRIWLTAIRHFPTIYQQQLYQFDLNSANASAKQLFQNYHLQLMEDDPVMFVQILEEYFLIGLMPLSEQQLIDVFKNCLDACSDQEKRLRGFMALSSLYFSFTILQNPVHNLLTLLLNELISLKNRISPIVNSLRTFIFLIIDYHLLRHSTIDIYTLFTNSQGGNFAKWFDAVMWSTQFVLNKFAFKLNAAVILKAISQIGPQQYGQMLVTPNEGQLPMDMILKVIGVELGEVRRQFMFNSYNNLFRNILPNEITPDFMTASFRKTRLFISDPFLVQIIDNDLHPSFRQNFGAMLHCLDWADDDLQQRVGVVCAIQLCRLLGWQHKIKTS